MNNDNLIGCNLIWKLMVAPRVKTFVWLLLQGKVKTTEFIHSLNIGPTLPCSFCRLTIEIAEHLFHLCHHSILMLREVCRLTNIKIEFEGGITSGIWIETRKSPDQRFNPSVIYVVIQWIWKAKCNAIFRDISSIILGQPEHMIVLLMITIQQLQIMSNVSCST